MGIGIAIGNRVGKSSGGAAWAAETPTTDADGNVYTSVVVGTQEWIVESFRSAKYTDGSAIPNITDNGLWAAATSGAYCAYANSGTNKTNYGLLYNWDAITNPLFGISGFRVPTLTDFNTLLTKLGAATASNQMRDVGTTYWTSPNTGATNTSGMTVRGSGDRDGADGIFNDLKSHGFFWTATSIDSTTANVKLLYYDYGDVLNETKNKKCGFAVRLMRDL